MYGREILILTDNNGKIIDANEGFAKILGYEREIIIGRNIDEIIDRKVIRNVDREKRIYIKAENGEVKSFDLEIIENKDCEKNAQCFSLIDITRYSELENNRTSLSSLYDNAKDIIYSREIYPERKFIYMNNAITKLLGYTADEICESNEILEEIVHPEDLIKLRKRMIEGKDIKKSLEVRVKNKEGKYIWFEDICIPTYDSEGRIVLVKGISRCIQERKEVQSELEEQIYNDPMTQLRNRKYLENEFDNLKGKKIGVIMIDLDNLKEVNDGFGHLIGDELILAAANIFNRVFKDDIKVRIGGDEFVIVIENANTEILNNKLKKLDRTIEKYNKYSMMRVSLSKGYSIYKKGKGILKDAIEEADYNMYKDKRKKKSLECKKNCFNKIKRRF